MPHGWQPHPVHPLMNAAAAGNVELIRLLLARGADVNTVASANSPRLKNGPLGLASFTALTLAAAYGGPETIQLLLDHGSKVNVCDARGLTPLMLSISTDHSDPRTVRSLLEEGADPSIKSLSDENAADWATNFQNVQVMETLHLKPAATKSPAVSPAGNIPDLTKSLLASISCGLSPLSIRCSG